MIDQRALTFMSKYPNKIQMDSPYESFKNQKHFNSTFVQIYLHHQLIHINYLFPTNRSNLKSIIFTISSSSYTPCQPKLITKIWYNFHDARTPTPCKRSDITPLYETTSIGIASLEAFHHTGSPLICHRGSVLLGSPK